ncbi:Crp/Fnr family transcriptional regulator [Pseudoteredinibacter isoporae]|uniref:CRP-like cAMP-binding protein n=1 Tax=Pseudoteredinibacter isoporae TaxID=570281 RepID=A0A7X0JTK1_9GAMM|nr:Crp/Fnr family transcriptional regulator [Pseudoteredinibacter isoporae]MBB6521200.1 CRP-like cAMP-binding protein [Pseudoteredinibacter isoporae]NHO86760.1 Crp/Fnr family transcriptional regulator [Pseudoteredinibacter isoporae]NIB24788.1 Crp/Fnr family transcriptional regulator [Pseudoteredinibacter isoporae]
MSHSLLSNYTLSPALTNPLLWPLLESIGQEKRVIAGTQLFAANSEPQYCYVILEGLLRQYYPSAQGRERNKNFFREGQLAGSLSAWLTQSSCPYELQALEDSTLWEMPINQLRKLQNEKSIQDMLDKTTRELFLRNEQREAVLLTKSGEERYQWLLSNESWIAERLPQYHIASYLGMDAVSLSRLKAKLKTTN